MISTISSLSLLHLISDFMFPDECLKTCWMYFCRIPIMECKAHWTLSGSKLISWDRLINWPRDQRMQVSMLGRWNVQTSNKDHHTHWSFIYLHGWLSFDFWETELSMLTLCTNVYWPLLRLLIFCRTLFIPWMSMLHTRQWRCWWGGFCCLRWWIMIFIGLCWLS